MKHIIKTGETNKTVSFFIVDSSSTIGATLSGLAFDTAGLVASYRRPKDNPVAIPLVTQTITGAHTDGGFVETDDGEYSLDLPDEALAAGAESVIVTLKGATNMLKVWFEIDLVAYDPHNAASLGLTNVDAAVSSIAGAVWDEPLAGHLTSGTVGLAGALGSAAIIDTVILGTPTSTTLVLSTGSTVDDFYKDQLIYILSGTGLGQGRPVLSYEGSTKTITVDEAWVVTPAESDRVLILVSHVHPVSQIQSGLATATAVTALPSAIFDGGDIDGYTLVEALRLGLAVLVGEVAGSGAEQIFIKGAGSGSGKTRVEADTDGAGNRANIVTDVSP